MDANSPTPQAPPAEVDSLIGKLKGDMQDLEWVLKCLEKNTICDRCQGSEELPEDSPLRICSKSKENQNSQDQNEDENEDENAGQNIEEHRDGQ